MPFNANDWAGSSNDRKRIPGFDDYKGMSDAIEKYGEDLRKYFAMAKTRDELKQAKDEIIADEETEIPDKIIKFFYEERLKSMGPDQKISKKEDSKWDDGEVTLNSKIRRAEQFRQGQITKYRPAWN